MNSILMVSGVAAVSLAVFSAAPPPANADVLMQASARTQCMDVTSGLARLSSCNGGAGQNIFSGYGPQRYGTLCLQGTGGNNRTNQLALKACNNSSDQMWSLDSRSGNYKNNGGWCAAVTSSGTVIAAQCYGGGTYAWSTGIWIPAPSVPPADRAIAAMPPGSTQNAGDQIVVRGAGSAPQSGGSVVAQGAGNIVAQGGGNIIKSTGGAIVAQGGGN